MQSRLEFELLCFLAAMERFFHYSYWLHTQNSYGAIKTVPLCVLIDQPGCAIGFNERIETIRSRTRIQPANLRRLPVPWQSAYMIQRRWKICSHES